MNKNMISTVVIVLLLGLSAYVSWNFYFKEYNAKDTVDIHVFPKTIGEWDSEELLITEKEYAILETRNAFVRNYLTKSGKEVLLYIIYSENNRKVSHPPEVCYTGGGVSILEKNSRSVGSEDGQFDVVQMHMQDGPHEQFVYYWFKVGDSFTPSYWQQQMLIAWKTLIGKPSSSAMIRVSTFVENGKRNEAIAKVEEFIQVIQPHLPKYLP